METVDKMCNKIDEYELQIKEQKEYIKELEEQSQTLANSLDITNETYNKIQDTLHSLNEEYNKAYQQRDTLIRVIDNLLKGED